ncbi:MAG: CCA tRNA nucleotidyltransferase [Pseudomonadota bacterium]
MRIEADWLASPAADSLTSALERAGHRALFVGGCVRNALLGTPVTDLDLATDAVPHDVMHIADAAGLKPVPTGIEHGTVTVVHEGVPIEVTTFRADVETDGRHATVRFSHDVAEDAARRDFTMNALYCDGKGEVIDPLGGLPDLLARRLRFVGNPVRRVREDYLRILRFFRFHAWYADPDGGLDTEGLAACAAEADGLTQISAERIGAEMKKLLSAPDPGPAVAAMGQTGVLAQTLPGADAMALSRLIALEAEAGVLPRAMVRLAALGGTEVDRRLRLSRAETRERETLLGAATGLQGAAEIGWRLGSDRARAVLALRAALTCAPLPEGMEKAISEGVSATFPVRAKDLMPAYQGADLGRRLTALERAWVASGFAMTRADLLALPDI